jgi:hypothetical protein
MSIMPNSSTLDVHKTLSGSAPLQPELVNVRTAEALFGLSRAELWRVMDSHKIDWIHYKTNPDAKKGIRLINLESLRTYLRSFSK